MGGRKSPVLLEFFRAARAFFLLWGVGLSLSYPIWSNEIPEVILLNDPSQSTTVFSDREVVDQLILRVNGGENQRSDFGRLIWLDRISSDYQAGITSYFQGAKSLVEESVRSGDSKRVFLAVTDSSFPDASMIRFENGDVLMQLTSGLLSMETVSDDRLVGFIGHEFGHLNSRIQERADEARSLGKNTPVELEGFGVIDEFTLLERTAEIEVDQRGLTRVIEQGRNPWLMPLFLQEVHQAVRSWGLTNGVELSSISATHAEGNTRVGASHARVVGEIRVGGTIDSRFRLDHELDSGKTGVSLQSSQSMRDYEQDGKRQEELIDEVVARVFEKFDYNTRLEELAKGKVNGNTPDYYFHSFNLAAGEAWDEIRERIPIQNSLSQNVEVQREINRRLRKKVEDASLQHLGHDFQPRNGFELEALAAVHNFEMMLDIPNLGLLRVKIILAKKEIEELSKKGKSDPIQEKIYRLEKRLEDLQSLFERVSSEYEIESDYWTKAIDGRGLAFDDQIENRRLREIQYEMRANGDEGVVERLPELAYFESRAYYDVNSSDEAEFDRKVNYRFAYQRLLQRGAKLPQFHDWIEEHNSSLQKLARQNRALFLNPNVSALSLNENRVLGAINWEDLNERSFVEEVYNLSEARLINDLAAAGVDDAARAAAIESNAKLWGEYFDKYNFVVLPKVCPECFTKNEEGKLKLNPPHPQISAQFDRGVEIVGRLLSEARSAEEVAAVEENFKGPLRNLSVDKEIDGRFNAKIVEARDKNVDHLANSIARSVSQANSLNLLRLNLRNLNPQRNEEIRHLNASDRDRLNSIVLEAAATKTRSLMGHYDVQLSLAEAEAVVMSLTHSIYARNYTPEWGIERSDVIQENHPDALLRALRKITASKKFLADPPLYFNAYEVNAVLMNGLPVAEEEDLLSGSKERRLVDMEIHGDRYQRYADFYAVYSSSPEATDLFTFPRESLARHSGGIWNDVSIIDEADQDLDSRLHIDGIDWYFLTQDIKNDRDLLELYRNFGGGESAYESDFAHALFEKQMGRNQDLDRESQIREAFRGIFRELVPIVDGVSGEEVKLFLKRLLSPDNFSWQRARRIPRSIIEAKLDLEKHRLMDEAIEAEFGTDAESARYWMSFRGGYDPDWAILESPRLAIKGLPDVYLAKMLLYRALSGKRANIETHGIDVIFDHLLTQAERSPEVAEVLERPEIARVLFSRKSVNRLVWWQLKRNSSYQSLERERNAREAQSELEKKFPLNGEFRSEYLEVLDFIVRILPEPSYERDRLLAHVENRFQSTDVETNRGRNLKLAQSYEHAKGLGFVDFPEILRKNFLASPNDHAQLFSFLIGHSPLEPRFSTEVGEASFFVRDAYKLLHEYKNHFQNVYDPFERAIALQSLLTVDGSVLEADGGRELVKKLILGSRVDKPVISAIYDTYFETLPKPEARALLPIILAHWEPGRNGVPLPVLLGVMGPFGDKAGQALRASSLLDAQSRAELDHIYDFVSPPERERVVDVVQKIFGKNYESHVVSIGGIKGSGSVNYNVELIVRNPVTGGLESITLGIQKDAVLKRVESENLVWEKVGQKLSGYDNSDYTHEDNKKVREAGRLIEETRRHTTRLISKNGPELDRRVERKTEVLEAARQAYNKEPHSETNFRSEVLEARSEILELIDESFHSIVHPMSTIEFVRPEEIEDLNLRKSLMAQIVELELSAILEGRFDGDGHRGNWLVDLNNQRLVRIDYAQFYDGHRQPFSGRHGATYPSASYQRLLRALLEPKMSTGHDGIAQLLSEEFKVFFHSDAEHSVGDLRIAIGYALDQRNFPSALHPTDRILAIEQGLKKYFSEVRGQDVQISFSDEFRTLLSALQRLGSFVDDGHLLSSRQFLEIISDKVASPFGQHKISYGLAKLGEQVKHRRDQIRNKIKEARGKIQRRSEAAAASVYNYCRSSARLVRGF